MLSLKNITKNYKVGTNVVKALRGVSIEFRKNEFVSILGQSGCGKTTLLNIIGGLDRYDKGNLIINNVSTKDYKDRDWDSYRNHTIGFVFQSYNLIPHQSILTNVELALTISGVSKRERKARAVEALEKVGLADQLHKKPNQLSGGQMQRVAIARALVNNPDILLADEPTGALDTETSVQVMELLKQVADDRLVIMVTHNPELAEEYSTRIVKLKDGKIIGDSNPYNPDTEGMEAPKHMNLGKASMSVLTAFTLSLKNLLTKKGRTVLTSFAGSIGIIGIALILSVSSGFQNYIDKIQEDTLTSYPLSINRDTADPSAMLLSMTASKNSEKGKEGTVKESQVIRDMFSKVGTNDMSSFRKHLDDNKDTVDKMVTLTDYEYDVTPLVYSKTKKNKIIQLNPSEMMSSFTGATNTLITSKMTVFNEMLDDENMLNQQYDVVAGRWAKEYDEVVLVLPDANSMSDMLAYSLGLRDPEEFNKMLIKLINKEKISGKGKPLKFTYEELMKMPLKLVNATDTYKYNKKYKIYEDMTEDTKYMKKVYNNAVDLKIVGIVTEKDGVTSGSLSTGVGYTKKLTNYVIDKANESPIVKKQLKNEKVNALNNKRFDAKSKKSGLNFKDMISIDKEKLKSAFGGSISEDDIANMTKGYMTEISSAITTDTTPARKAFCDTLSDLTKRLLKDYIKTNGKNGTAKIKLSQVDKIVNAYLDKPESKAYLARLESAYIIPQDTFKTMYSQLIGGFLKQSIALMSAGGSTSTAPTESVTVPSIPEGFTIPEDFTLPQGMTLPAGVSSIEDLKNLMGSGNTGTVTVEPQETIDNKTDSKNKNASMMLSEGAVDSMVNAFVSQDMIVKTADTLASKMTEAVMQKTVMTKVGELSGRLMQTMASAFKVDEKQIASAFKFNLDENEVKRLMETMTSASTTQSARSILQSLGYQDTNEPSTISFYFKDFDSKERFIDFLDSYNEKMEKLDEDKVIKYTDLTGILMSSVKTIVDAVSYVLIAFVSISLIVSSIMIGIITYISVLERKKEIGILRAIGASKRNISSIFNAETFIVGLFAGIIGIGVTLLLLIPINAILNMLTGDIGIAAILPMNSAFILVVLSVILTLIGGIIPSKQAAKKDPVLALRSE